MEDFLESAGALGIATRLRRLADEFAVQVNEIYEFEKIEFDAVYFPILKTLDSSESVSLNDIANLLGRTHSAISQLASKMEKSGLIVAKAGADDARKRMITLSVKGKKLVNQLRPVWAELTKVLDDVISTPGTTLLSVVREIEKELSNKRLIERYSGRREDAFGDDLEIQDYDERYKAAYYDLNMHWIQKLVGVEPGDSDFLKNPEKTVLQKGGMILFAKLSGAVVGTCALVPRGKGRFELARFAVTDSMQRKGIGRAMCKKAIERAKKLGAKTLYLETHSEKLRPGFNLYRSLGFKVLPHPDGKSKYQRVDSYMELKLTEHLT